MRQAYSKIYMECITITILKKKNKSGRSTLPNFKTIYKATIIQITWHYWRNRRKDQWTRIKKKHISKKPCQLIILKSAKEIQWSLLYAEYTSKNGPPRRCSGKEPACQCGKQQRHRLDPWVGEIPWRKKWQPTPVLLPGKSHEQRSLVNHSPWGLKESDTTERLHFHT